LNKTENNRKEWEEKGQDIVEEMMLETTMDD
jgi:hypothetical protein